MRRTEFARRRLARTSSVSTLPTRRPASRNPEEPVPYTETKGAVLLHVLEELFQHLGQMELTRDALVAAERR